MFGKCLEEGTLQPPRCRLAVVIAASLCGLCSFQMNLQRSLAVCILWVYQQGSSNYQDREVHEAQSQ